MRLKISIGIVLVAATLLVFWQTGSHDFIILDDRLAIRGGAGGH